MNKTYKARWIDSVSLATIASVDIRAKSDKNAISAADKLDLELGLPSSAREIYESNRCVEQRTN